MNVAAIHAALEEISPAHWAVDWDRIGLQVGDPNMPISHGAICLDLTIDMAQELKPGTLVIAHHPLIWDPLKAVRTDRHHCAVIAELLRRNCAFIAAHTNWDAAPGGINDALAELLGLSDVTPFGIYWPEKLLKLSVTAPRNEAQGILEAASAEGAGVIGDYAKCSFAWTGEGTFQGSDRSHPAVGEAGQYERVEEVRIEMRVPTTKRSKVEAAVRRAHPYEEPAIDWFTLANEIVMPVGRIGHLPAVMPLSDFRDLVDEKLGARSQVTGMPDTQIRKVAVFGGASGDEWPSAKRAGADVFVTGEIKHSTLIEASYKGMPTVEAGHYATEQPGMLALTKRMRESVPEIEWNCLESVPGKFGVSW